MIKALEDFGWLFYVQSAQGKAKRVFYIEKNFEDGNWTYNTEFLLKKDVYF